MSKIILLIIASLGIISCSKAPDKKIINLQPEVVMDLAPISLNLEENNGMISIGPEENVPEYDLGVVEIGTKVSGKIVFFAKKDISSLNLDGFRNAEVFLFKATNCGTSLKKNRSCQVQIEFTPQSTDSLEELIQISEESAILMKLDVNPKPAPEISSEGMTIPESVNLGEFSGVKKTLKVAIQNKNKEAALISVDTGTLSSEFSVNHDACGAMLGKNRICQIEFSYYSSEEVAEDSSKQTHVLINGKSVSININHKAAIVSENVDLKFQQQSIALGEFSSKIKKAVYVLNSGISLMELSISTLPEGVSFTKNTCGQALLSKRSCHIELEFNPSEMTEASLPLELVYSNSKARASVIFTGTYQNSGEPEGPAAPTGSISFEKIISNSADQRILFNTQNAQFANFYSDASCSNLVSENISVLSPYSFTIQELSSGTFNIYAKLKNGNVLGSCISASILIDITPPAMPETLFVDKDNSSIILNDEGLKVDFSGEKLPVFKIQVDNPAEISKCEYALGVDGNETAISSFTEVNCNSDLNISTMTNYGFPLVMSTRVTDLAGNVSLVKKDTIRYRPMTKEDGVYKYSSTLPSELELGNTFEKEIYKDSNIWIFTTKSNALYIVGKETFSQYNDFVGAEEGYSFTTSPDAPVYFKAKNGIYKVSKTTLSLVNQFTHPSLNDVHKNIITTHDSVYVFAKSAASEHYNLLTWSNTSTPNSYTIIQADAADVGTGSSKLASGAILSTGEGVYNPSMASGVIAFSCKSQGVQIKPCILNKGQQAARTLGDHFAFINERPTHFTVKNNSILYKSFNDNNKTRVYSFTGSTLAQMKTRTRVEVGTNVSNENVDLRKIVVIKNKTFFLVGDVLYYDNGTVIEVIDYYLPDITVGRNHMKPISKYDSKLSEWDFPTSEQFLSYEFENYDGNLSYMVDPNGIKSVIYRDGWMPFAMVDGFILGAQNQTIDEPNRYNKYLIALMTQTIHGFSKIIKKDLETGAVTVLMDLPNNLSKSKMYYALDRIKMKASSEGMIGYLPLNNLGDLLISEVVNYANGDFIFEITNTSSKGIMLSDYSYDIGNNEFTPFPSKYISPKSIYIIKLGSNKDMEAKIAARIEELKYSEMLGYGFYSHTIPTIIKGEDYYIKFKKNSNNEELLNLPLYVHDFSMDFSFSLKNEQGSRSLFASNYNTIPLVFPVSYIGSGEISFIDVLKNAIIPTAYAQGGPPGGGGGDGPGSPITIGEGLLNLPYDPTM